MFWQTQTPNLIEVDKENIHPEMEGKQSPFNVEARRSEIFERLFSKSSELSSLTNEIYNLTNNMENRDTFSRDIENLEYNDMSTQSQSQSQYSIPWKDIAEGRIAKQSQRNSFQPNKINQISEGRDRRDLNDSKKEVDLKLKTPKEEMNGNLENLQQLVKYQDEFYERLQEEIEAAIGQIESKTIANNELFGQIVEYECDIKRHAFEFENDHGKLTEQREEAQQEHDLLHAEYEMQCEKMSELETFINDKSISIDALQKTEIELIQEQASHNIEIKQKTEYLASLQKETAHYKKFTDDLEADLRSNFLRKKTLNNELQELKGNIRVYCRVRPVLDTDVITVEDAAHAENTLNIYGNSQLELIVPTMFLKSENNVKEYKFNFEQIFDQSAKQQDIFSELSQLVQSALDGYNVCIFAYGQTGSGKTFTMEGNPNPTASINDKGVIARSIELIFDQISYLRKFGWKHSIYVSFQEIYIEQVRDLLTGHVEQKGEVSPTLIESPEQFYPLLKRASENRAVAETECNGHSSRSHCIFQLKLKGRNFESNQELQGTLNLIDLAGSERLNASKVEGERLKETQAINKSLTSLGDVITALANKDKHIPYRNSKLTYILQNYLGGDSKTLMLVNISPLVSSFPQTLCSLRFAAKVKSCEIGQAKQHAGILKKS